MKLWLFMITFRSPFILDNHEYTVSIFTGNHMWAGTNATVCLTVIGSNATRLFKLGKQNGNNRNAFEPGQ